MERTPMDSRSRGLFAWWLSILSAAALAALHAMPLYSADRGSQSAADAEGLVRVDVPGVQQVFAQPEADLSGYSKIMLDPIEVSFRKNWRPAPGGQPITNEERREIREGLAKVLREAFTTELEKSGRYQVVDEPGDDVLRIKPEIRDLQINAPDLKRSTPVRSYAVSSGEMTLVAELRDSSTGDLIARVIDHRRDRETPWLEWTTRADNIAAARQAAQRWATTLREQLDAAREANRQQ